LYTTNSVGSLTYKNSVQKSFIVTVQNDDKQHLMTKLCKYD